METTSSRRKSEGEAFSSMIQKQKRKEKKKEEREEKEKG